jgi:hypothetical protein
MPPQSLQLQASGWYDDESDPLSSLSRTLSSKHLGLLEADEPLPRTFSSSLLGGDAPAEARVQPFPDGSKAIVVQRATGRADAAIAMFPWGGSGASELTESSAGNALMRRPSSKFPDMRRFPPQLRTSLRPHSVAAVDGCCSIFRPCFGFMFSQAVVADQSNCLFDFVCRCAFDALLFVGVCPKRGYGLRAAEGPSAY